MNMKKRNNAIGSFSKKSRTMCQPVLRKSINRIFKKLCSRQRKMQINNYAECTVNLIIINKNRKEIEQLIMECKGNVKLSKS